MKCLECQAELDWLNTEHLLACSGLTLQEYAIRHHLSLDLLLSEDHINHSDNPKNYPILTAAPGEQARSCLAGMQLAGRLHREGEFFVVPGEIKRLDLFLWHLQWLQEYGFQFRQEYIYHPTSHRVIASNKLKTRVANLHEGGNVSPFDSPDLLDSLAVLVAFAGELRGGYLFLPLAEPLFCCPLIQLVREKYAISFKPLAAFEQDQAYLLRSETREDAELMLSLLKDRLVQMPGLDDQFYTTCQQATVVKQLVFDSAHFITDHPGKCSNLHGGRYVISAKVKDRIDPATGFVIDYGYLKKVLEHRVVKHFDHQNINYVDGALAWRSSTELLCVFAWEQLIEYLPGLSEIQINETDQSYCCYSGPSLAEFQSSGTSPLLNHFLDPQLGRSALRQKLLNRVITPLKVVGED